MKLIRNFTGGCYPFDIEPEMEISGYGALCRLECEGHYAGMAIVTDDGRQFVPEDWLAPMPTSAAEIGEMRWVCENGHIADKIGGLPFVPSEEPASPRLEWYGNAMRVTIHSAYARGNSRKAVVRRILRMARKAGLCAYQHAGAVMIPIASNRDYRRVQSVRTFLRGKSLAKTARNNYARETAVDGKTIPCPSCWHM